MLGTLRLNHPFIATVLLAILHLDGCSSRDAIERPSEPIPTAVPSPTTRAIPSFDAAVVGQDVILLGRCHRPLGQVMTLTGTVVEGPFKGYEGGPNIIVQRIDGVATQEFIRIPLMASTFEKDPPRDPDYPEPMFYVAGKTYQLRGFETGVFVGTPPADYDLAGQTCAYHMQGEFDLTLADKPKMIASITFAPTDFLNQHALLAGTAANVGGHGYLVRDGWRMLSADDGALWPDWMVGKSAEVDGVVREKSKGDYNAEHASRRLIELADEVGHRVELHGLVGSFNEDNWQRVLHYRGQDVLVRNLPSCPGWTKEQEWQPVAIRGTLAARTNLKPDDPVKWVIDDPSWAPLPALLSPEVSNTSSW